MIRAIVIDDEKPSREVICNYLKEYCSDIQVITTASSVKIGYKAIKKFNPDLVFLDIELGDGTGFDLLTMFDKINFKVIFVTAFSEFAIKALRVSAIDYLLKPVKIDELKTAVEKAKVLNGESIDSEKIATLIKNLSTNLTPAPTLIIPHIKGFDVLKVKEIIMCKADGYCTNFYLTGKRKITSSKNLKQYEDFLTCYKFFRVHHSYLVNLNHVCSYSKQGEILLIENIKAYLGENYKLQFLSEFKSRQRDQV